MSIQELIKRRGMRNVELARMLNITEASASRILAGKQALTAKNAARLACRLNVKVVLSRAGDFCFIGKGFAL
jgi:plasmid maintenance system antidote protein VapI